MPFNGGKVAWNRKSDRVFMLMKIVWPHSGVCQCPVDMRMAMHFKHLLQNYLTNQNQVLREVFV